MKTTLDEFARTRATEWYLPLEVHLRELSQLDTRSRLSMNALRDEARGTFPRAAQTFETRCRPGNPLPESIHRVRLCGVPATLGEPPPVTDKPFRRWYTHLTEEPTRKEMFQDLKDVSLLDPFMRFYERAMDLNKARHALVLGRTSIEQRASAWAEPRAWEAGELSIPAPLLLSSNLPGTSLRAMGAAWRFFLRVAALQFELLALAERFNGSPPWKGLRLAFRIDREHPYGRFIWTLHGQRLSRLARLVAKGKSPRRIDDASLPDRLMRELKIPSAARKAITPHECHRRRMDRIYQRYVEVLGRLLSTGPRRLREAQKLLDSAGFPDSPPTPLGSDPTFQSN